MIQDTELEYHTNINNNKKDIMKQEFFEKSNELMENMALDINLKELDSAMRKLKIPSVKGHTGGTLKSYFKDVEDKGEINVEILKAGHFEILAQDENGKEIADDRKDPGKFTVNDIVKVVKSAIVKLGF